MPSPPWEPDFDFYMTMIEDRPASIVLDLAAGQNSPLDTHPILIVIRVPMKVPHPDGLRDGSELEALSKLEDDFTEKLATAVDAIYVGRTVCDGDTTLYLYAPQRALGALDDLPVILGDPGVYEPDFHALATDSTIILPWDREVLVHGELVPNPLYAGVLGKSG